MLVAGLCWLCVLLLVVAVDRLVAGLRCFVCVFLLVVVLCLLVVSLCVVVLFCGCCFDSTHGKFYA